MLPFPLEWSRRRRLSIPLSYRERTREGGQKRDGVRGERNVFPVLLLLRRRAIEEVDNGKIAHALSTCFLHLHSTPKSQHATFSVVKASESFWTLGEEAGSIG